MSLIKKMQDRFGIFGELIAFLWAQKLWWMVLFNVVLAAGIWRGFESSLAVPLR